MLFSIPVLLGLTSLVSARCGVAPPSEHLKALHATYRSQEAAGAEGPVARDDTSYVVDTYLHIITDNSGNGDVSDQQITDQMDVLNSKFGPTGFSFNLVNTSSTSASKFRNVGPGSSAEYQMKTKLRKGRYQDLNIYIDTIAPDPKAGTILGYATFPDRPSSRGFNLDGVVVDPGTLPRGKYKPYDLGITVVHEVGHWLGLLHTFQGGCSGNGDYVNDTPAEASPASGCMTGRDSCPGQGLDPIHNFMDYSDDSCLNTFSSGQIARMKKLYKNDRINVVRGNDGEEIDPAAGVPGGGPHSG